VAAALKKATQTSGLQPPNIRMHAAGMAAITATARDLSDYANRRGPIDAKVKAARALGTPEGRREAQELVKMPIPPPPFDVLLLADTGDNLQEIAAILPYYDVDRSAVQTIGPALWADPASGSGAVRGAWYAAPDNTTRSDLERDYAAKFGARPRPIWHLMRLLSPRWLSGLQGATWQSSRSPADLSEPTAGLSCRRTVKYGAG
jgi:branched-chain amino acid transport system substrate-binding protein